MGRQAGDRSRKAIQLASGGRLFFPLLAALLVYDLKLRCKLAKTDYFFANELLFVFRL